MLEWPGPGDLSFGWIYFLKIFWKPCAIKEECFEEYLEPFFLCHIAQNFSQISQTFTKFSKFRTFLVRFMLCLVLLEEYLVT